MVEPGSEERATRVETTRHPNNKPNPDTPDTPPGFDTPHSLTLAGRLNQLDSEWPDTTHSLTLAGRLNQLRGKPSELSMNGGVTCSPPRQGQ